jgi:uncharacterized damage-inducible protein DinB
MYKMLIDTVKRHFKETLPLIEQLTEINVLAKPFPEGKQVGEIVLHMVRSVEFYMKGITTNQWEPLRYSIEEYDSAEVIIELATNVFKRAEVYASLVSSSDLGRKVKPFEKTATIAELLQEMIEHSIHHRGQITAYYRLLGVSPIPIEYII